MHLNHIKERNNNDICVCLSADLNLQWDRLCRAAMDWRRALMAATRDQVLKSGIMQCV